MALKSILEIDVQDDKFKAFQEQFNRYRAALAEMPGMWKDMASGTVSAATAFDKMVGRERDLAGAARLTALAKGRAAELDKAAEEAQRKAEYAALGRMDKLKKGAADWGNQLAGTAKSWRLIRADAKGVEGHITETTRRLASWAAMKGVLGGLVGVGGGLYGLDKLAQSAASGRRESMATGVPFGAQRAFGVDYSRFVDTDAMIGNIAAGKSDATSAQFLGLRGAGLSSDQIQNRDAADLGVDVLHQLPRLFTKGADDPLLGAQAQARGLTSILSVDDIKRYLRSSPEERQAQDNAYASDKRGMNVDAGTLRAWADLNAQIGRAGTEIETAFIKGLAPLAPEFTDLSKGVVKLVADFVGSKEVKSDLDSLVKGLDAFDKAINNPDSWWNKTGKVLDNFSKAEQDWGRTTHDWLHKNASWATFDHWTGADNPYAGANPGLNRAHLRGRSAVDEPEAIKERARGKLRALGGHPNDDASAQGKLGSYTGRGDIGKVSAATLANGDESLAFWRSKGLSKDAAAGLVGMEQGEALYDPSNKTGDGGNAHGSFQWHKPRRDAIQSATGIDIDNATHKQQLEAAYWEFTQSQDAGARRAWAEVNRAGVTAGQAAAAGTTYFERPLDKSGQSMVRGRMAQGWLDRANSGTDTPYGAPPKPMSASSAIGDAAALAARGRLAAGQGTDADRDLEKSYRQQQNAAGTWNSPEQQHLANMKLVEAAMQHRVKPWDHHDFKADVAKVQSESRVRKVQDEVHHKAEPQRTSGLGLDKLQRRTGHDISIYNASGADVGMIAGPASYG